MPSVIGTLHPDPEQRFVPEQLCQAHGDLWADRFALRHDIMQMLARDAQQPRDLCLGFARLGDHVLSEQFARMRRAAVGVAAHARLLVVLLEIQHIGVAISELERDAPWPVHMDRIARGVVTSQRVKVETGKVHVLGRGGGIQGIEPPQDTLVKPRVDLGLPRFPEGLQLLVRERLYHFFM